MQPILAFILTLGLFSYFLVLLKKRFSIDLNWKWLLIGYYSKIALGCLYGYIYLHYYGGDDTWYFNKGGEEEYQLLTNDWAGFFRPLNPFVAFQRYEGWGVNWYYYLVDLEWSFITKPLGLFHFISGGNYYINLLLYNFLQIWSAVLFFKWVQKISGEHKLWPFLLMCMFPSIAFWLSGIRGDGYLMLFLMLLVYSFHSLLHGFRKRRLVGLVVGVMGVLVFRQQLVLLMLPAFLVWYLSTKKTVQFWKATIWVYGSLLVVFCISSFFPPRFALTTKLASLQHSYRMLHGKTILPLGELDSGITSYLKVFPQAVSNSFLRPFPWEAKGALQLFMSFSNAMLLGIMTVAFLRYRKMTVSLELRGLLGSLLLFSLSLYIIIGYTVPYPGAIVRYIVPGMVFFYLFFGILFNQRKTTH